MFNRFRKILTYCVGLCKFHKFNNNYLNIMSIEETLQLIIDKGLSVARFGDGELMWAVNKPSAAFQKPSEKLAVELQRVALVANSKCIVCMPPQLRDVNDRVFRSRLFWRQAIGNYGLDWEKFISSERIYGNTDISRFYITYSDKSASVMQRRVNLWHKIFSDRKLILVEGSSSRLGVGSDLFAGSVSVSRIIVEPENAFEHYNEILNSIINVGLDHEALYLLAIGPTATILAYELANRGVQALDVGHIDIEYIWYEHSVKKKVKILGKSVNEAKGKKIIDLDYNEAKYQSEIILDLRKVSDYAE